MRKERQYPPFFGVTSYGIRYESEELADKTDAFLRGINYKGFGSLEFKWDDKKGEFIFIEMNPRLPLYNSMFFKSGINLVYAAFLNLKHGSFYPENNIEEKKRVHWINFRQDVGSYMKRRKVDKGISVLEWIKSVTRANSFAYWHSSDPSPFKRSTLGFISSIMQKIIGIRSRH
jgi:predicted ATP-grasp superfamily ATP-dependent carboligase